MFKQEYPRPQFERESYINLNGEWSCHISRKCPCYRSDRENYEHTHSKGFEKKINVPFAPETPLSGLNEQDVIDSIYYHRQFSLDNSLKNKRIILHFGAVFYHSEVYIDGKMVGFHDGGSSSFSFDITDFVNFEAPINLVVKATANLQDGSIPSGKQSSYITSYTCFYHRTTGIWQTVWIEAVDKYSLLSVKTLWNDADSELIFTPEYRAIAKGLKLNISLTSPNGCTVSKTFKALQGIPLQFKVENPLLWDTENPNLYGIEYKLMLDGNVVDKVVSYTGLRTIEVIGNRVYLNGKSLYQRLVLDQGFYPESNWTSPSDEALVKDIKLSQAAGFNGARLHQKVFEERFFYHADRLGYIVWGESPSWGLDYNNQGLPHRNFLSEWGEIIKRDINHPCIIAWTPLNETYFFENPHNHRRLHQDAYNLCKAIDPTRPVNDSSGYIHYITDLWTVHTYIQNPEELKKQLTPVDGEVFRNYPNFESKYKGQPYLVDEYGGIKWDPDTQLDINLAKAQNLKSWGYGDSVKSEEEFFERLEALTNVILSLPHISGYCYTQLTDVEQEKNGVYFYSRKEKFPIGKFKRIFEKKPCDFDL